MEAKVSEPAFGWTACLFAKPDLVAHHHDAVEIVPDGGYLLVIAHLEGDDNSSQTYVGWIGLAALPSGNEIHVEGVMEDVMSEFGNRTGVRTSYEIHGTATGSSSNLVLLLESTQQPRMFDARSPLHRVSVAPRRLADPETCVFEKQKSAHGR